MKSENIVLFKRELHALARNYHTGFNTKIIEKNEFLPVLWRTLASFVRYNKSNALVQHAVHSLDRGDFIPRAFVVLSILYGSFSLSPRMHDVLKDFVELLDKDLIEEELRVYEYAKGAHDSFYPELFQILEMIREVYSKEEFDHSVLPPNVYHAFSLLALNRINAVEKNTPLTQVFGELSILHHQMNKVFSLTEHELVLR